jgi:hypothetical protein
MKTLLLLLLLVSPVCGQWCQYRPQGAQGGLIFDDVLSHCTVEMRQRMYDQDKIVYCHEATHGVNSQIRQCLIVNWAGLYTRNHRAFILRNPRVRLDQVAPLVSPGQRDEVYDLYLVKQRKDWNDFPLYLLDEWSAYINGTECAIESNLDYRSELRQSLKFSNYVACLDQAIQQYDPQYDQLQLFRVFVKYQNDRINVIERRVR